LRLLGIPEQHLVEKFSTHCSNQVGLEWMGRRHKRSGVVSWIPISAVQRCTSNIGDDPSEMPEDTLPMNRRCYLAHNGGQSAQRVRDRVCQEVESGYSRLVPELFL
jgi:hypothetical protein